MDSWPMIRACKEAQWRGLYPWVQAEYGSQWDSGRFPFDANDDGAAIWAVESEGRTLVLMSIKRG